MTLATVETPCAAYRAMQERWEVLHDLRGGTLTMRAAGTRWLPRHERETEILWRARLARSFLYNAFNDTIEGLASKPFTRPITLAGEIPERLRGLAKDADRQGANLTTFSQRVFEDALVHGLSHILVDYPQATGAETLAEERERGLNPYLVHVPATALIGWRSARDPHGREVLSEVRIREERTENDGPYDDTRVTYTRIIRPSEWVLYRNMGAEHEPVEVGRGPNTLGAVPLVTLYLRRTGLLTADPPLEDLAWVNVAHWQSQSDQRNILHIARCPILAESGVSSDDKQGAPIIIGPTSVRSYSDPQARAYWIEVSGGSIGAGRQDLVDLEAKMQILGNQPLVSRTGEMTATGEAIEEAKSQSAMQCWLRLFEAALRSAYALAAQWVRESLPETFAVDIWSDFAIGLKAAEEATWLLNARTARELDRTTFLREIRRRGLLAETVDIEEVAAQLEAEGPDLGAMLGPFQAASVPLPEASASATPAGAPAVLPGQAVQDTALNGAQIQSLVDIVAQVAARTLPADSAIELILASFPTIDEERARKIIAAAAKFEPAQPTRA